MGHANARLTVHGRLVLVERVAAGRPVAHVAKELGVSRQCAHRWVRRFGEGGPAGLADRSSRPRRMPSRTCADVEKRIVAVRAGLRCGPARISAHTGVPVRTVSRVLARHGVPRLAECDPLTGQCIRATRHTTRRYEHPTPGDLIHLDVKKIGKIPPGGGWRVHGRGTRPRSVRGLGYDYVHAAVDDHSRLAYAEVLDDERGTTCAAFLLRATAWFADQGIPHVHRVLTDNAKNYTVSHDFAAAVTAIDAHHKTIKPHCPWQNGKVERFNRTLQTEWAYHDVFQDNPARTAALAPWLDHYNTERNHTALNGHPPISRVQSPT
jgi:transposase InsO family protein